MKNYDGDGYDHGVYDDQDDDNHYNDADDADNVQDYDDDQHYNCADDDDDDNDGNICLTRAGQGKRQASSASSIRKNNPALAQYQPQHRDHHHHGDHDHHHDHLEEAVLG